MTRRPPAASATWKHLRAAALALPEAYEEFPWGDRVVKVRKKIFVFLGEGTGPGASITVKLLGDAHAHALSLAGAKPTAYNLGNAGWVTIPLKSLRPHPDLASEWLEASYRLIAPKRLAATL